MPQSAIYWIYAERETVICLGQHLIIQDRWGKAGKMHHMYLTVYLHLIKQMNQQKQVVLAGFLLLKELLGKIIICAVLLYTTAGSMNSTQI